jgi:hypothetical protein
MAKKSMKDAAAAGTSVFDQIASGNVQSVQDVTDAQDVQNAKNVKDVNKKGEPLERLNLKIPAEIKEYLTVAAAKASIAQRRNISLTEYLIQLVREDMAKNNE